MPMSGSCTPVYIPGLRPNPTRHACAGGVCARRQAEVVAHQLSHTPQVDSIFNVPAGKDNLCIGALGANFRICRRQALTKSWISTPMTPCADFHKPVPRNRTPIADGAGNVLSCRDGCGDHVSRCTSSDVNYCVSPQCRQRGVVRRGDESAKQPARFGASWQDGQVNRREREE